MSCDITLITCSDEHNNCDCADTGALCCTICVYVYDVIIYDVIIYDIIDVYMQYLNRYVVILASAAAVHTYMIMSHHLHQLYSTLRVTVLQFMHV